MLSTKQERDDKNPSGEAGSTARNAPPERPNPGCSLLILSGIILLIVSMGIVGLLLLIGVDLHQKFWLVFAIFAVSGAFMYQLAKRLQTILARKDE